MNDISPENPLSDGYACADMALALNSIFQSTDGSAPIEAGLGATLRCVYVGPDGMACNGIAKVVQGRLTEGNVVRVMDEEGNEVPRTCLYRSAKTTEGSFDTDQEEDM